MEADYKFDADRNQDFRKPLKLYLLLITYILTIMAVKDEARVRKIGHLKVAVGFLILAVMGPLMWLTLSLRVLYPRNYRLCVDCSIKQNY